MISVISSEIPDVCLLTCLSDEDMENLMHLDKGFHTLENGDYGEFVPFTCSHRRFFGGVYVSLSGIPAEDVHFHEFLGHVFAQKSRIKTTLCLCQIYAQKNFSAIKFVPVTRVCRCDTLQRACTDVAIVGNDGNTCWQRFLFRCCLPFCWYCTFVEGGSMKCLL